MQISYLKDGSYKIKGQNATIYCNPKDYSSSGICIFNNPNTPNIPNSPNFIYYPGEYEISQVNIYGYQTSPTNTSFLFQIDGFSIAFLGDCKKALEEDVSSELSEAHILIINPENSGVELGTELVSQIEPLFVIIPQSPQTEPFSKSMGKVKNGLQDKVSLKSVSELPEETELIILNPVKE